MGSLKILAANIFNKSVAQKLLASNRLTTSAQLRPVSSSVSRFISTNSGNDPDDQHHSPAPRYYNDVYDEFSMNRRLNRLLKTPYTTRVIEPEIIEEKPESLHLLVHMSGVKEEDVKISVEHNTVFIEAEGGDELKATVDCDKYNCWIDLPDNMYKINCIKAEMKRNLGELKLTVPKLKEEEKLKEAEMVCKVEVNVKE